MKEVDQFLLLKGIQLQVFNALDQQCYTPLSWQCLEKPVEFLCLEFLASLLDLLHDNLLVQAAWMVLLG